MLKILSFKLNSKKVRVRSVAMNDDKYRHENLRSKNISEIDSIEQLEGLFLVFIKCFKYIRKQNLVCNDRCNHVTVLRMEPVLLRNIIKLFMRHQYTQSYKIFFHTTLFVRLSSALFEMCTLTWSKLLARDNATYSCP